MGLTQTVGPTIEPVTLAEMKLHLRVDEIDEDTLIESLITAARESAETFTWRQFITATYELTLDTFPGVIYLPRPILQSVTSITYVDSDSAEQTVDEDTYVVKTDSVIGEVYPAYGESWPTCRGFTDDITVTFKDGYGDAASDVPDSLKAAIRLFVGHLYENREATVVGTIVATLPLAVESLLWNNRVVGC